MSSATWNASSEWMDTLKQFNMFSVSLLTNIINSLCGFIINDAYDLVVDTVSNDVYYFEYIAKREVNNTMYIKKLNR